jgi:hypothetical protein
MTLQQTLQANTSKVKELFDKLQNTSDQAVKTRENLFEELARELRLHADLEQRDLIPALRKNDETKDLATEAAKTNRELRAKVDQIEGMPKGDAEFLPRLGELRKLFEQQVREERRELVPALRQNLSDEEVARVEEKIDARREKADEEERARAEARREEARRERERAEALAAGKRAANVVADATKRNARELRKSAGEAVQKGVDTVEETSGKIADSVSNAAQRLRDDAKRLRDDAEESVTAYRETARERGRDVKAVANALRSFAGVGSEVRSVMMNSLKRSGRDGIETAKRLIREPRKFGEVQREYMAAATRNAMESTQEILLIVRRAANDARQPVDARLRVA